MKHSFKAVVLWIILVVGLGLTLWQIRVAYLAGSAPNPVTDTASGGVETPESIASDRKRVGKLPPIVQTPLERNLQGFLAEYIAIEERFASSTPEEAGRKMSYLLQRIALVLRNEEGGEVAPRPGAPAEEAVTPADGRAPGSGAHGMDALFSVWPYKYFVRRVVERRVELLPNEAMPPGLETITDGQGSYACAYPEWDFPAFEEAYYKLLFCSPKEYDPVWSAKVLLAVRTCDFTQMSALHKMKHFAAAPQWPVEAFRQLFTYASEHGGRRQFAEISKVIGKRNLIGLTWAEIGYGPGKIFGALRGALGPDGTIVAVEIDDSCKRVVSQVADEGQAGWGKLVYYEGYYRHCGLPQNSVDIIHPGLLHIGDGDEGVYQRDWKPWLESARRALKPGGLLIIDDAGDPGLSRVRTCMARAGFVEVAVSIQPHAPEDNHPVFVAAYRVK